MEGFALVRYLEFSGVLV